jgi:hypothetical protein
MRVRLLSTSVLTAALAMLAAGCGATDNPAAPREVTPAPSAPSQSLLGTLLNAPQVVSPVNRNTPLKAPISVQRTIGVLGGVIVVPGTGLTIVVPPLAVARNTNFTVTALAGSALAYDFGPHGTKFTLPLVLTQDLHNTDAAKRGLLSSLNLKLGYFPDATKITSVTELLTVTVGLPTQTAVATVWHFSGYIWASGRDSYDDF